jgi:hypothetical protein
MLEIKNNSIFWNFLPSYVLRLLVRVISIGLPFYRPPDTEQQQPELYEKNQWAVLKRGSNLKHQFCALLFVRMRNKGRAFKLASTVRDLGKFDVVVEYSDNNCRNSHIFVHHSSKSTHRITMQHLLADRGDFSLRTYYESYIHIEEKFNSGEMGVEMNGNFDDSLFIIYTNANIANELQFYIATDISEEKFLMTGGSVLQFNEQKHKIIYGYLQDLPKHREFLSRFRIFYSQADEDEMKVHIKCELKLSMTLDVSEFDIAYARFFAIMKEWCQYKNYVLKDTNSRKIEPLWKTAERLRSFRKNRPGSGNPHLTNSVSNTNILTTDMKQPVQNHKAVLTFAPGSSNPLATTKIHHNLSATQNVNIVINT